ncbi:O-antigen ligase [Modicisalibacter muralis]|uniref:O-antigen ligase n=1 Tax=Modicisalibacter muralis TaxID=119000 RepID=A0A1G9EYN8_9GAMM|nr:O-antigen ligase [Halomonas muralis]
MTPCKSLVGRRLTVAFLLTALATFSVALHVSFPNMGGHGLRLPFNAALWMGMALMIALALWPATRGRIRVSGFQRGLWLVVALLWLPLAWSWDATAMSAVPRLLGLTAGALLLLGLEQLALERRHWVALLCTIYLGTLLETAFAWVQYTLLEPGNWVGFSPDYGRPWGIFQQSNVLASFLATGLAISAWLLGEAQKHWLRSLALLAPLAMPAMLLVLVSRIGWLASLVVIVLSVAHLWGRDRRVARAWLLALLAGCVIAVALWFATEGLVRSSAALGNTGARTHVYMHALRMILEAPLVGWGYGDFQYAFIQSFADWRAAHPGIGTAISGSFDHPHNELLLWGVEGGVLPMAALLGAVLWIAWRLWRHGPHGERLMLMALLAPLALHAMTEYPFYHSLAHWLAFVLLLGLLASRCWPTTERANRYTFGIRVGA